MKTESNNNNFDNDLFKKQLDNSRIFLIVYLLKKLSNKEHMLTPRDLCIHLTSLTGHSFPDDYQRTIKRELLSLCDSVEYFDNGENTLSDVIRSILGGRIIHVIPQKSHHYFYFQPDFNESHQTLVFGSIINNRHVTEEEKDYLISRLSSLSTFVGMDNINPETSQQIIPIPDFEAKSLTQKNTFLENVQTIYEAIDLQQQIEISYGYYATTVSAGRKIQLLPRKKSGGYILNPYALIWNAGQYYLIATYSGQTNPIHFRVDRILNVQKYTSEMDARIFQKREPIPANIKPYFKMNGKSAPVFLPEKYTADFPLMIGIFDENKFVDALIECTTNTLSIVIDSFGTDSVVIPSTINHGDVVDYNGNPLNFIIVRLNHVQYNNLPLFCLEQQATVTDHVSPVFAIYPPQLVEDIHTHLQQSLQRYQDFMSSADDYPHPFISNKTLGAK